MHRYSAIAENSMHSGTGRPNPELFGLTIPIHVITEDFSIHSDMDSQRQDASPRLNHLTATAETA
jgi:hypothetical protein